MEEIYIISYLGVLNNTLYAFLEILKEYLKNSKWFKLQEID